MIINRRAPTLFAFTSVVLVSAFLLFQIQPLIAKFILPWFGGGSAVWGTSMLFFQLCLLAGYAYAHVLARFFSLRHQAIIHLLLLCVALVQFPITPSAVQRPELGSQPALQVLWVLSLLIGLPFFVLSSTAPLLQSWLSRTRIVENPYRFYSLSNAASLIALLSYPFVFEPNLSRTTQLNGWSVGFGLFLLLCAYCSYFVGFRSPSVLEHASLDGGDARSPNIADYFLWLALPATAVTLLLGVTNELTRDLASIPFLWILPLSVYLLTFILCFDGERWYRRVVFLPAGALAVLTILLLLHVREDVPVYLAICLYSVALFVLCMICHGELNGLRPPASRLTAFYLMIALGGAAGSALVALVLPILADRYVELQLGVLGVVTLAIAQWLRGGPTSPVSTQFRLSRIGWVFGYGVLSLLLVRSTLGQNQDGIIHRTRNFYGVLAVGLYGAKTPEEQRWLRYDNSYHGAQYTASDLRRTPISYYASTSGIARALLHRVNAPQRHIGMVGLGVGSIAAHTQVGDTLRIYEINPAIKSIAQNQFTYLSDSPASVQVVLGDARYSLERESTQGFDILVLDAFTSDSIPTHLMTREAFETYLRHLNPDGVIAVLISSWHFDFAPLLKRIAREFGLHAVLVRSDFVDDDDWGSEWMVMTRNLDFLRENELGSSEGHPAAVENVRLWTDDFASPFQLLK